MASTVYLTSAEAQQFAALPEELRKPWKVIDESVPADTESAFHIRLGLMRLRDPKLANLQMKAQEVHTEADFAKYVASIDLKAVNHDDLAELYFALGPVGLSEIIVGLFSDAKDVAVVEAIAAFTHIRHSLIESL